MAGEQAVTDPRTPEQIAAARSHPSLGWTGDDFVPPQCWLCKHYRVGPNVGEYCVAFPGGMPDQYTTNAVDHRDPQPDDGGVQFELAHGADAGAYIRLDTMFHNRKAGA